MSTLLSALLAAQLTSGASASQGRVEWTEGWVIGGGQGYSEVLFRRPAGHLIIFSCATLSAARTPRPTIFFHFGRPDAPLHSAWGTTPLELRVGGRRLRLTLTPADSSGSYVLAGDLRRKAEGYRRAVDLIGSDRGTLELSTPELRVHERVPLVGAAEKLKQQAKACRLSS